MRAVSKLLAFAVACFCAVAVQPAGAACGKSNAEVADSIEFMRFSWQLERASGRYPPREHAYPGDDDVYPPDEAILAGHLLARQVQHLGDSAHRREMFDCIHNLSLWLLSAMAAQGHNPAELEDGFNRATFGALGDDEGYIIAPVDNHPEHYPSVFGADWRGTWQLEARSRSVHNFELAATIVFEENEEGVSAKLTGTGDELELSITAQDNTVSFEHWLDAQHRYVWTLVHEEDRCSGGIETHHTHGVLEWDITSCTRQ